MREELLKEIESRDSLPPVEPVWESKDGKYSYDNSVASSLDDIAKSLRILIELQLEHLSGHGD
jgi:hypothetical protein